MKVFQRGETVICPRNVMTKAGVYHSPTTSFTLAIYAPTGLPVVDNKDMIPGETGKYHYDYTSAVDAELGTYNVYYTAVDGDRTTIFKAAFAIEA